MLISEAISQATAVTGQVVETATLVRWLSELDGRLAFEFYRADAWAPYDPVNDLGCELLVPYPWDGMYVHHLESMTYYTNGEYDRYENARVMLEKKLAEFRAFMQRTQSIPCRPGFPIEKTGGSAVTVITAPEHGPWFWLSAYALAVKHGYRGTEEEWLASMIAISSIEMTDTGDWIVTMSNGTTVTVAGNYTYLETVVDQAEDAQEAAEGYAEAAAASAASVDADVWNAKIAAAYPTDSISNAAVAAVPDGADGIPVKVLSADLTGAAYCFVPNVYIDSLDSFKAAWFSGLYPRTVVVPCEGGKTYTVTTGLSSTLRVASFPAYPSPGDTPTSHNTATGTTVTLTTGASDVFILVQLFINAEASNTAFATAIAGFTVKDQNENTPSWSTVRVHRVGKNLMNRSILMPGVWGSSGDPGSSTNGRWHSLLIPVTGGEAYAWSASNGYSGGKIYTVWFDADGAELSRSPLNSGATSVVVEAPANAAYASVSVYLPSEQAWVQFERGDAASAYEAYSAQTVTLNIADGTLSAPLTTRRGKNDMRADAGTLRVTYRADPALYLDKKLAALGG